MRIRIAVAALLLILAPVVSFAFEAGVRGYYWMPKFSAKLEGDGDLKGSKMDVVDDLNVDQENFPMIEAFIGGGSHHFSVSAIQLSYDGSNKITREFTFNDKVYGPNETVDSSLDLMMIDAVYQYDLIDLENVLAGFSLGPAIQLKYFSGKAALEAQSDGTEESSSFTGAMPLVGLGAHIGLLADVIEARGRVTGIGYAGNTLFEGFAEINFTPFPFLDVGLGYKTMMVDIDFSDIILDADINGPYIAAALKF